VLPGKTKKEAAQIIALAEATDQNLNIFPIILMHLKNSFRRRIIFCLF
jgi:hypothetical protein